MIHQGKVSSSRAMVLEKVKSEFDKFRVTGRGKYPVELRALACSAVGVGIGQQVVAQAGGVSLSAVNKWVRLSGKSKFKAKRLNLVESPEKSIVFDQGPERTPTSIRIRLVSGVEIELSKSDLNVELLSMLSSIRSER